MVREHLGEKPLALWLEQELEQSTGERLEGSVRGCEHREGTRTRPVGDGGGGVGDEGVCELRSVLRSAGECRVEGACGSSEARGGCSGDGGGDGGGNVYVRACAHFLGNSWAMRVRACACVCACVRARARAYVRACMRVHACACVCVRESKFVHVCVCSQCLDEAGSLHCRNKRRQLRDRRGQLDDVLCGAHCHSGSEEDGLEHGGSVACAHVCG